MLPVRRDLPSGTVTFLFTDIEGSTRLLRELGAERYGEALAEHRRLIRNACAAHSGVEVDTQGDAFFVAFPTAPSALEAARALTEALASGPIKVRVGLHTGTPLVSEHGYVGDDVHRAARIAAAGHGGQVLVSSSAATLVETELTDLGEHRFKDLAVPERVYQLGDRSFPPLRTISNTNLPRPTSSFLGRERELSEVIAIIEAGARLATVTGPGGTGKTRLALEAASTLVTEYKAGVFWVGLASLRDHALVSDTIAQTLGARSSLASYLGERELLLLIDNFEHVIEAAPELSALLKACPNLTLLVTSRERLRVQGEVEYPVLALEESEAVELFCARSRVEANATVVELCRRLDNLPLALELAAARTNALSPKQMLERLSGRLDLLKGGRDADPRQETLRTTMDWSYQLLAPDERQLFAWLAVFRGGCTLEAAEEVCEAGVDTLQSLVDKSLLRHMGERFSMLETIREYAAERLEALGDADKLRRRHAEHFLVLAEEAEPNLRAISTGEWLDRLERDRDNLRAALDHLEASGHSELVLRLAGALWRFWHMRAPAEGWRRLESALNADARPTAARAKALNGATALAHEVGGDEATARVRAEEALALHRSFGDTWGAAYSGFLLASAETDLATAEQHLDESARLFRELGDEHYALLASSNLAWKCYELGDRERARALHEETLRRGRATSNKRMEAISMAALAVYAVDEHRTADALSMLTESIRIRRDVGDLIGLAADLRRSSFALAVAGRAAAAARLLSSSEALREQLGTSLQPDAASMDEQTLAIVGAQLDKAAFAEAWKQGRALTVDEAVAVSLESAE
jgi:predicted ATPase/class 3 adenylate cyclase